MTDVWPWATLVLLGAFHGVNPAMGWLFAVGLGLQERDRAAVQRALIPIALGHAASIASVVAAVGAARALIDPYAVRLASAGVLVVFSAYRLLRGSRHRARVGMRVGFSDLTLWSFLTSTAHGAGLMVVPALLGLPAGGGHAATAHSQLAMGAAVADSVGQALATVAVHTLAMLAVAGAVALVVFDRVGLGFLRRAWVNIDLLWALALVAAGALMFVF